MATLLNRAAEMINRLAPQACGVTITATRVVSGVTRTCTITDAFVGLSVFPDESTGATTVSYNDRDYLIPVASYLLGASNTASEPQERDRITETINGTSYTFELRPRVGEKAWRWSDNERTRYRVHAQRLTNAAGA